MLSTMQKFCQICVAAAMMNPDDVSVNVIAKVKIKQIYFDYIIFLYTQKENLPILAAADGNTELHDFLQKCIQNRQVWQLSTYYLR